MGQRLTLVGKVNRYRGAVAKASLNRATKSAGVDPKPSDLAMGRVKVR